MASFWSLSRGVWLVDNVPSRHQTVGKEEGQISRSKTLLTPPRYQHGFLLSVSPRSSMHPQFPPQETHPYSSQPGLGQGIPRIRLDAQPLCPSRRRRDDDDELRPGQQPQQELEGRGETPPDGGQDGDEAEGEEPRVPGRGHIEDDGDARLEEGRVHGWFRAAAAFVVVRRRRRRRRRRRYLRGRGRGGGRGRLWREREMACRGAPTEGGGVGHHSLGQAI